MDKASKSSESYFSKIFFRIKFPVTALTFQDLIIACACPVIFNYMTFSRLLQIKSNSKFFKEIAKLGSVGLDSKTASYIRLNIPENICVKSQKGCYRYIP